MKNQMNIYLSYQSSESITNLSLNACALRKSTNTCNYCQNLQCYKWNFGILIMPILAKLQSANQTKMSAQKRQLSKPNKTQQKSHSFSKLNRSFTATFKDMLNTTKPSIRSSTLSLSNVIATQRAKQAKQGKQTKEVRRIVDFDVTAEGQVEYIGEIAEGKRKYLTKKMIVGSKDLFNKVIDFYCEKLKTLVEGKPKQEQNLLEG